MSTECGLRRGVRGLHLQLESAHEEIVHLLRLLREIVKTFKMMQQGCSSQMHLLNSRQLIQVDCYAPEPAHAAGAFTSTAAA
eukprot:2206919-Pleurochrysis_carterae.AAC.1